MACEIPAPLLRYRWKDWHSEDCPQHGRYEEEGKWWCMRHRPSIRTAREARECTAAVARAERGRRLLMADLQVRDRLEILTQVVIGGQGKHVIANAAKRYVAAIKQRDRIQAE